MSITPPLFLSLISPYALLFLPEPIRSPSFFSHSSCILLTSESLHTRCLSRVESAGGLRCFVETKCWPEVSAHHRGA
ncbi:hypothetical protein B0H16DRAFT_744376 [Mycena metata]|uniref:Secreted protein n=1 Tax=Mycena metata TaxID=1033252 RepID=A0AAD7J4Q6_9AGAR|nr:hypothetical protein B0H16DRAFT_744376 [Mycena metata]